MATTEERIKILTMVQEGKITPEQAAQLLEALSLGDAAQESSQAPGPQGQDAQRFGFGFQMPRPPTPPGAPQPPFSDMPGLDRRPRWLRVRVTDTDSGRPRVNVRLPVSMVNIGLKMGSKFAPQVEGLDTDQLVRIIESGEIGQIVDVYDEEDGEHVEVFLE